MHKFLILFSCFTLFGLSKVGAQSTPNVNQRNKALFDQTVDKLNFRTIEFVYDRKYPRKKFPADQNNFKTRKTFDDFEGNAAFKKLFMNYNDVSEKFKNKFGKGSAELPAFEKALNEILINKDFEFFISSLTKDDKIMLIRALQQINKKGIAQYVDAAGKPRGFFSTDSVIEEGTSPIVKNQKATTAPESDLSEADTAQAVINTAATPEEVFQQKTPRRDWLSWIALLFSVAALALAASIKLKDVPEIRGFVANNYQKRAESVAVITKPTSTQEPGTDPALSKKIDNLTREVEGLYAQMDELIHKNYLLEQKLAGNMPKPFDLPKPAFFEPRTETQVPNPISQPEIQTSVAEPEQASASNESGLVMDDPEPFVSFQEPASLASLPAIEKPEEIKLYLSKPDEHGFFWNDEVSDSFVPNRSFFTLTLAPNNHYKGSFELINDQALQRLAYENKDSYLDPVCDLTVENEGGKRLETASPGTIVLNGDQWVLVKKATVRVV